jgi:hypothetical protein
MYTVTVAAPSAPIAGDLLLTMFAAPFAPTTVPAGWSSAALISSGALIFVAFSHAAGAAEPASYDWGFDSQPPEGALLYLELDASSAIVASTSAAL